MGNADPGADGLGVGSGRLPRLAGGSPPGVVYYPDLPRPAEALVPPARAAEVLRSGRPVLMSLSPGMPLPQILSSGQAKVRIRMRFQRLEYLVLEWAGEPAAD